MLFFATGVPAGRSLNEPCQLTARYFPLKDIFKEPRTYGQLIAPHQVLQKGGNFRESSYYDDGQKGSDQKRPNAPENGD